MLFIYYPKCTTCGNAKKYLDDNNIKYEEQDIKLDNPNLEQLTNLYKKSNLPLKKFFNTSGLVYKELNLKEKLDTMSEEEQLELLSTNGMLIKRPILETEDKVILGYKKEEYERINRG